MDTQRIVGGALVGLFMLASPSFAMAGGGVELQPAKVGLFQRDQARRAAKQELQTFLRANPRAGGRVRLLPNAIRLTASALGAVSLPAAVGLAVSQSMSGRPETTSALLLAASVAVPVVGFKVARAVSRNVNTLAVRGAMESGAAVTQQQLLRWANAGLVTVESANQ